MDLILISNKDHLDKRKFPRLSVRVGRSKKTCQKPFLSEVGFSNFSSPAMARYFISPQSVITTLAARLAVAGADLLDRFDNIHPLDHASKHDMLAIEPRRGNGAKEKLRAVGVGAGIGHAQHAGVSVFELKIFVGELLSVDRFATGAVVVGKVTP